MNKNIAYVILLAAALAIAGAVSAQATAPATQPATTLITLHAESRPAREVLDEIVRQAQATLVLPKDLWAAEMPVISLNVTGRPFWNVMSDFCRQAKVSVSSNPKPSTIAIVAGDSSDQWQQVSGPLLLRLSTINLTRRIDYTADDARVVQPAIRFQATCEPSMRLLSADSPEQLSLTVDGQLIAVSPATPPASNPRSGTLGNGVSTWSVQVPLPDLPAASQRIDSLRFNIRALLQIRVQTWDIADLSKEQSHEVGGWKLVFKKRASLNQMVDSIEVAVTGRPASLPDNLDPFTGIQVLDKDGVALMRAGYIKPPEKSRQTMQFMRRTPRGEPAGESARIQWDVPTDIRYVSIPFELKAIDLDPK